MQEKPALEWHCESFESLRKEALYHLLQLRAEVFVVEQNCPYQDLDNKDFKSLHLLGRHHEKLVAYTRLVAPGVSYTEPSIGRVVVAQSYRKYGIGLELMQRSIDAISVHFGNLPIRIGAQYYLQRFYESLGFKAVGAVYDEDGIPHIEMIRPDSITGR